MVVNVQSLVDTLEEKSSDHSGMKLEFMVREEPGGFRWIAGCVALLKINAYHDLPRILILAVLLGIWNEVGTVEDGNGKPACDGRA